MQIFNQLYLNPESQIPLVAQLTDQLTWLIAGGELQEGDRLPGIREMAAALGINMHTVRAAYQNLEAEQLVSVRPRIGTVVLEFDPQAVAAGHPGLRTNLIGVVLPNPAPVYLPFITAIRDAAAVARWMPIVGFSGDNPLMAERMVQQLVARQVDGYILVSTDLSRELADALDGIGAPPAVFVDSPLAARNSILSDSEGAAFLATSHLLQHGYQSVGLITAPTDYGNVLPCINGYRRALAEAGFEYRPEIVFEVQDFDPASGRLGAELALDSGMMPRAFFVVSDGLALGAMQAIQDAGLAIPGDIALASYNNIEAAAYFRPALTTANFPAYRLGEEAVRLLETLLQGVPAREVPLVLETELIVRQTCGCVEP